MASDYSGTGGAGALSSSRNCDAARDTRANRSLNRDAGSLHVVSRKKTHSLDAFAVSDSPRAADLVLDPVAGEVNGDWGFKDVETTHLTHGLHPYPARMVPQVAERILARFVPPKGVVWDPFCGSGTVLLESMINGHPSIGTDLSPFACLLAKTKTTPISSSELKRWSDWLVPRLRGARADEARLSFKPTLDDFTLDVDYWFRKPVIRDLGYIRSVIEEAESIEAPDPVLNLLRTTFSWTVRQTSNQRRNEFKRYRKPKDELGGKLPITVDLFLRRLTGNTRMIREFSEKCKDCPLPEVTVADSSIYRPDKLVSTILTSPPYGDSTTTVAYGQYASLMMEWLGLDGGGWRDIDKKCVGGDPDKPKGTSKSEILKEIIEKIDSVDPNRAKVVQTFFGDMRACLSNFQKALVPGGRLCIVIGDRTVRSITVPNSAILKEDAEDLGFSHEITLARRIFFKVMPYRVNPIGRTGEKQDTPAIGKDHIIVLRME
jgi:hypothetical protein